MLIRPYGYVTTLEFAVSKAAASIVVSDIPTIVAGPFDWYYLFIESDCAIEVVKVLGRSGSTLYVARGQDYAEAVAFPAGSKVYYGLTKAEILDATAQAGSLKIFTDQVLYYKDNVIGYGPLSIQFKGANYLIGGSSPEISIGRQENAYGCCNGSDVAAPIPSPFIYLTSQMYPYEVVEGIQTDSTLAGELRQLLHEYDWPVEAITTTFALAGELRDAIQEYEWQPEAIATDWSLVGELRTLLLLYEWRPEAVETFATLTGSLAAPLIEYVQPPEAIATEANLTGTMV